MANEDNNGPELIMEQNFSVCQFYCTFCLPLCMLHFFCKWSDFGRNYITVDLTVNIVNSPEEPDNW